MFQLNRNEPLNESSNILKDAKPTIVNAKKLVHCKNADGKIKALKRISETECSTEQYIKRIKTQGMEDASSNHKPTIITDTFEGQFRNKVSFICSY